MFSLVTIIWPDSVLGSGAIDQEAFEKFAVHLKNAHTLLQQHQRRFALVSLEDTIGLISLLRDKQHLPLTAILDVLKEGCPISDPRSLQRSVELCVRIWLTINVHSPSVALGPAFPYETTMSWPPEISLQDLIQGKFRSTVSAQNMRNRAKLDGRFTAAYLVNVCGLRLHWTDYLTDHLNFDAEQRVFTVYKHKICLLSHWRSKGACPIPSDVLSEALDTLDLLFPFGDAATKRLLAKENQSILYQLGNRGRDRELDLSHYEYWREELDDLVECFRRPPRTWTQLATDRRNLMEWAAFWVTVAVAFLTLVSIPCNIIQATYSVKAYRATIAQNSVCPQT